MLNLKDKLPVSYLLFTTRGRISRSTYWTASVFIWCTFYILFNLLQFIVSLRATWFIYPLLFIAVSATAIKRLHDINLSGRWLFVVIIPVLGSLALIYLLAFRKGNISQNRFGTNPKAASDYFTNKVFSKTDQEFIINDVTQLNPVKVTVVKIPESIPELQEIIKNTNRPVSVGGGRFSMGGQTASPDTIHIDMRKLSNVISFSSENKIIKVQAGIRWCDIQHFIDSHELSIKIMQTYANFTVGGALSVNCHGRYIGLGPVILSVKSIDVVTADGTLIHASRTQNQQYFYGSIGCYNCFCIIAAVEFELAENVAVQRVSKMMTIADYRKFFSENIRNNSEVVFHNADIYPPKYNAVRAVTWSKTDKNPTEKTRLMPLAASYPLERYFIGAFSKSNFGKWRRQYIYDPVLFFKTKVHWRNYEAGYDVAELEPDSRLKSTYVLQEYFVPVANFEDFSLQIKKIFRRHKVNVINVSVRHALEDSGSMLAWAKQEVFAFVIWHKQNTDAVEKNKVAVWTRELIDAAISFNGSYYLPYQPHATKDQLHKAYPRAKELMEIKSKLDPDFKFRNVIWDTYYEPKPN